MKYTAVKFGQDAVNAIMEGVREVTEATATTLGPLGRNVLIDRDYQTVILHDGVSVANSINPEDPYKRNGAKVVQEAAKKQRDEVGDGTTAVMVLTQSILDETLKVTAAGTNVMTLRKELEAGADKLVKKIKKMSRPVKTLDQKIQIATISAEDAELGKMVADTIHKIGDEGVFTVEESKMIDTYVEHQEGMQIEKGFVHPFMITDPIRQAAVVEDCHVLVTDHPLNTLAEIGKFLEHTIFPNTKKVLFIAPDIGTDFMQVLLGAKVSGQFLGLAMRAPGIGSMQIEMMQDICALTGATLVTKEANMNFDDQPFEVLGKANRIVMNKLSTIITGGSGHRNDIALRVQVIEKQMQDSSQSDYDLEQLRGRKAKLTNGVAVIKVGGHTEIEMNERKERAIDAICATQSACVHGVVPGGEIVYLEALKVLDKKSIGEQILANALQAPFKRLVENAGYDGGQMLEKLSTAQMEGSTVGFDVMKGKFVDMYEEGVVDPASVPMTAIKTAVSVAVQLSSLGAAIPLMNEK